MKNQRDCARHHVGLALAFVALTGGAILMLVPSRRSSAQAVAPSWSFTGNLNTARYGQSATLLPNGKVLVAGGSDSLFNGVPSNTAELYDPATGAWAYTGNLNTARAGHTATLLPNGRVLVAGGSGDCVINVGCSFHNSAELYDPTTGTWSITANLNMARAGNTATLLLNGNVLVIAGGKDNCVPSCSILNSAELYDPATGTWRITGTLNFQRSAHSATRLPSGKVLVAAGFDSNLAELYDPATETWSRTGTLTSGRTAHSTILLTNGKVLIAGGIGNCDSIDCYPVNGAELYNPAAGTWSNTGSLNIANGPVTLLPDGKVLAVGGDPTYGYGGNSTELYDPATGTWSVTASLNSARTGHTLTLLPNGKVLVVGGSGDNTAELYEPGTSSTPTPTPTPSPTATPTPTPSPTPTATPTPAGPTWNITGNLNTGRDSQTATVLQNGKVLVAGGNDNNGTLKSAELYDPASGTWHATGNLSTSRAFHTASLLSSGRVLVVGGFSCAPPPATCSGLNSAELYDPATGTWTNAGNLNTTRDGSHTATLLPNGKILVAGGFLGDGGLNDAELYDPASGIWSFTSSLNTGRYRHTATLLQTGKVLVVGGIEFDPNANLNSAELYDPATETWSNTGNLHTARDYFTATLLANGKVLVAGGFTDFASGQVTNGAELYDPATGTWSITGNLNQRRAIHTATLLTSGKVLVAGGFFVDGFPNITSNAELYDSATGRWSNTTTLNIARRFHTATLLRNGKVLVAGGNGFNAPNTAELYDPGAGPNPIDDPQFFIGQQYRDFLGREPDADGFANWMATLTGCPNGGYGEFDNPHCDRLHVSAGFVQSHEFQGRGYWILRFGYVGLNRTIGSVRSSATYAEFTPALLQVGGSNSPAQEEAAKVAYANAFVQRTDFLALFPLTMTAAQYVNALETNAQVTLANKQALVNALNAGTMSRADVLRNVVESQVVFDKYISHAFVTMEYFGYLRRDPDAIGYQNWVHTLTADPSNYRHMIFGFIYSTEYRQRFGPS